MGVGRSIRMSCKLYSMYNRRIEGIDDACVRLDFGPIRCDAMHASVPIVKMLRIPK